MKHPPLEFFLGPCVLESETLAMDIAGNLSQHFSQFEEQPIWTFKGSFDKANRTSINSYRGPGIELGLKILEKIKKTYKVPIITDIHLPDQADEVASVVDVVQIPAFLCRQTDLIVAAASACQKYKRRLKVKKGQFLAPDDCKNIVDKAMNFISKDMILLTERGSSFGYNNLIVDMASFQIMKSFGVKAIYDATHSVQRPGGLGTATGGKREQIAVLAKAAVAAGADGVFMETHPNPAKALSDAETAMPIEDVPKLILTLMSLHRIVTI